MLQNNFRKFLRAATATVALVACASAGAFTKPPFPRVGGIQIGTPFNYQDPTYQANLAKQQVTILGWYPGMAPGGMSMNAVTQAIKAKNPNALVFLYVNNNELPYQSSGAWLGYQQKMDAMQWWLYSNTSFTSKVPSTFGPGYYIINNTLATPKDSNGDNAVDWITKFYVTNAYTPNPSIDGFFMDNVFVQPYVNGDWGRNGIVLPMASAQAGTDIRQGYARYFNLARSLLPNTKYQLGNITDWGAPTANIPEYQNLVNGGVMEAYIGKSWSIETYSSWTAMMAEYTKVMAAVIEPKLAIFNQWGSPTDYQSLRYGLGSCLLNDAYHSFTSTAAGYAGVVWFDEYDASLGQGTTPPTTAWQSGVWRRDFDNGIVLVNPKGNGAKTVTVEAGFVRLKGTQDPVTNNGQSVTTVTLKDRDGIILLRTAPAKRPAAPQSVVIEH